MRQLFVCNTPLVILNATNYVSNERGHLYQRDEKSDLIIVDQFPSARIIAERIKNTGLFEEVLLVDIFHTSKIDNVIIRDVLVGFDFIFYRHALKTIVTNKRLLQKDRYSRIFQSVVTHFGAMLMRLNPSAKFDLIEDGIGSYDGDIIKKTLSTRMRLVHKLFNIGTAVYKPEHLYVNNVYRCNSTSAKHIEQLPKWNNDFICLAEKIFYDQEQMQYSKGIIWLTDPDIKEELFKERSKVLSKYSEHIIVRFHPREKHKELYESFRCDEGKTIWELMINTFDLEKVLLISECSTAQFMPKFLFDKEPSVLFMGRIDIQENVSYKEIDNLAEYYSNKDRIFIPHTYEELDEIVNKFIKNKLL